MTKSTLASVVMLAATILTRAEHRTMNFSGTIMEARGSSPSTLPIHVFNCRMRGSWSGLMGSWTKAQIEGLIPWGWLSLVWQIRQMSKFFDLAFVSQNGWPNNIVHKTVFPWGTH